LLEDARGDVGLGVSGGEEMDFEFFGSVGVLVADAGDFDGLDEGDAEFLAQFAGEGLLEGFAGARFAAGKFPFEGRGVAAAALADQQAAVGTFEDGGDDVEHGGNVSWYGLTKQCGEDNSEASAQREQRSDSSDQEAGGGGARLGRLRGRFGVWVDCRKAAACLRRAGFAAALQMG